VQLLSEVLLNGEMLSPGQIVHSSVCMFKYELALHGTGEEQFSAVSLPGGDALPYGHAAHSSVPVWKNVLRAHGSCF